MGINIVNGSLVNANVRVKYSGASASITNATIAIDFDTPVYNEGFENISAGEFTIPVDGQYQIQLGLELTGSSNGTALVYVDGVEADVGGTNQNLARHRCSSVLNLTKGQTVSGRFPNTGTLTGSSNLNYLAITRIAQYSAGEPTGFGLATDKKYGLNKKIQIVRKSNNTTYNTPTTGVLAISNVPAGTYEITVGADYFRPLIDIQNASCYIYPHLNGSPIQREGVTGTDWIVGWARVANLPSGATNVDTGYFGYTSKLTMVFPLATNTFHLNLAHDNGTIISKPFYELKRLGDVDILTTEWD